MFPLDGYETRHGVTFFPIGSYTRLATPVWFNQWDCTTTRGLPGSWRAFDVRLGAFEHPGHVWEARIVRVYDVRGFHAWAPAGDDARKLWKEAFDVVL